MGLPDIVPAEDRIMIDWSDFELTDAGLEMRQKAIGEKMVLDFGYAMIGQGRLGSIDEVYTLQALVLPAAKVGIKRSVAQKTTHYLDIFIDNLEIQEEIFCTEIGVYARLGDSEEYRLYGYSYATKGYEQIPPGSVFRRKYHIGANTHISRSCSITVSYDDSLIYVPYEVFEETRPTELIAVVEHRLHTLPVPALYPSGGAFGIGGYGEAAYGGAVDPGIPVKLQPVDWDTSKVFTIPQFAGEYTVNRLTGYLFALSLADSTTTLTLSLR